jgi:hypothetical protein
MIEHICKLHDDATQKAIRPDLVWEAMNEDGRNVWPLVEVTGPWALVEQDGETLEKACKMKVGKYDHLRWEISEAYPTLAVTRSTILVGATRVFMKKSQLEFARVTKLAGTQLARFSWDVVGAALRGSHNIDTDRMARVTHNREYPLEPATATVMEEHEVDCEIGRMRKSKVQSSRRNRRNFSQGG